MFIFTISIRREDEEKKTLLYNFQFFLEIHIVLKVKFLFNIFSLLYFFDQKLLNGVTHTQIMIYSMFLLLQVTPKTFILTLLKENNPPCIALSLIWSTNEVSLF
jgi:hypothetical protein